MKSSIFLVLTIIMNIWAFHNVTFGVDYFNYKRVRSVVIFSCGNAENDFQLMKSFTKIGVYALVYHVESNKNLGNFWKATYWPIGIWLDQRCISGEDTTQIVVQATNQGKFGKLHSWLFVGNNFNETLIFLNEDEMSLLTDIVIAVEKTIGNYDLFDVYNPSKLRHGKLIITKFGTWRIHNGLNVLLTEDIFTRRCDLQGLYVRISGAAYYCRDAKDTKDCLTNYDNLGQDLLTKFGYSILETVGEIYNFRINVTAEDDWWDIYPNGSAFGMMPSLQYNISDFGITPSSARWASRGFGRSLIPIWPGRYFFIFRDPTQSYKFTALFSPFSNYVWIGIMLVAGIVSFLLMWVLWLEEEGGEWYNHAGWGLLITIGALCQQGLIRIPIRLSGRIALLSLIIFVFLALNYYSVKVVSLRIHQPPTRMNDSLWSLAKVPGMGFATFPYRLVGDVLRVAVDWEPKAFYTHTWSKIPSNETNIPIEIGLEKVRNGGFAYHGSTSALYSYIINHFEEEEMCELNEIHTIKPHQASLYERNNNPFSELLRVGTLKIWSSGVRKRNIYRWTPPKYQCSLQARTAQPLSLFDTIGSLILIGCGMFLTVLIFIFELLYWKLKVLIMNKDLLDRLKKK